MTTTQGQQGTTRPRADDTALVATGAGATDFSSERVGSLNEQSLPPKGSPDREGIDSDAITAAVIERHGLVNIDTIDHDEYWQIVEEHTTQS